MYNQDTRARVHKCLVQHGVTAKTLEPTQGAINSRVGLTNTTEPNNQVTDDYRI